MRQIYVSGSIQCLSPNDRRRFPESQFSVNKAGYESGDENESLRRRDVTEELESDRIIT